MCIRNQSRLCSGGHDPNNCDRILSCGRCPGCLPDVAMPDMSRLNQLCADLQGMITKAFAVRLDPELKGNERYISISEEMLKGF